MDDDAVVAAAQAAARYCTLLRENNLWPGEPTLDTVMRRHAIMADVMAEFPMVDYGPFFFMWFEKIETANHADELVDTLIAKYEETTSLDVATFYSSLWSRPNHDRDLPNIVLRLADARCWRDDALREMLHTAWVSTEFPESNGGTDRWLETFDAVGWLSDDDSERPNTPVRLYRGAAESHRIGMAWTADPARAAWFARRFSTAASPGHIYSREFQPRELLARFASRGEDEYIVWTADLEDDDDSVIDVTNTCEGSDTQ